MANFDSLRGLFEDSFELSHFLASGRRYNLCFAIFVQFQFYLEQVCGALVERKMAGMGGK